VDEIAQALGQNENPLTVRRTRQKLGERMAALDHRPFRIA